MVILLLCLCFNSMKVRLKPHAFLFNLKFYFSFNSMKVRLKHYDYKTNYDIVLFQFHEGPIKTPSMLTMRMSRTSVSIP